MHTAEIEEALAWKRAVEADFETAAGLPDRSFYSAFYSLPQRSPVMWLNLNPGGSPDNYRVLSDEQLARGQHEFWNGHGKTSIATGSFLQRLFNVPLQRLRSVQGTNVVWQRSPTGKDIDLDAGARITAPFLRRYLEYALPQVLIFGGPAAFELFIKSSGATVLRTDEVLMGNWGTNQARVFMAVDLRIAGLGSIKALVVSHPSRGVRAGVAERCAARLAGVELPLAIC